MLSLHFASSLGRDTEVAEIGKGFLEGPIGKKGEGIRIEISGSLNQRQSREEGGESGEVVVI